MNAIDSFVTRFEPDRFGARIGVHPGENVTRIPGEACLDTPFNVPPLSQPLWWAVGGVAHFAAKMHFGLRKEHIRRLMTEFRNAFLIGEHCTC